MFLGWSIGWRDGFSDCELQKSIMEFEKEFYVQNDRDWELFRVFFMEFELKRVARFVGNSAQHEFLFLISI